MRRRDFIRAAVTGAGGLAFASATRILPTAAAGPIAYEVGPRLIAAFDADGNGYGRSAGGHSLTKWAADGSVIWDKGKLGVGPDDFNLLRGIAVDSTAGRIYVADTANDRIKIYDSRGNYVGRYGSTGAGSTEVRRPSDVVLGGDGRLYISDTFNHRIVVLRASDGGSVRTIAGFGTGGDDLNGPFGLAFHPDGSLHVVDAGNRRVQVYSRDGHHLGAYGGFGREVGRFLSPREIVIDRPGRSYVADPLAGLITIFDPVNGDVDRFQPVFRNGDLARPLTLSLRPSGDLSVGGLPTGYARNLFLPIVRRQ